MSSTAKPLNAAEFSNICAPDRSAIRSSIRRRSVAVQSALHQDAVGIRPHPPSGYEPHTRDHDLDIDLAYPVLRALARVRSERLHTERQHPDRVAIADRPVHDDAGPAVLDGGCRDEVPDERRLE